MQPALTFYSGLAAVVPLSGSTETVVCTLNGVVTPLGPMTVDLLGGVFVTTGTTTTAVVIRIRRSSLTGTLVGDQTGQAIAAAAGSSNWYPVVGQDTPGELTGGVYVVTATDTGGGTGGTTVTAFLNAAVHQLPLLTSVDVTPDTVTPTNITWIVPGDQRWTLRSLYTEVSTVDDGAGVRTYMLTITDGTNTVAQVGAQDGGIAGLGKITWCDVSPAFDGTTGQWVTVSSIPKVSLRPGYHVNVQIISPSVGDNLHTYAAWYDFVFTTPV